MIHDSKVKLDNPILAGKGIGIFTLKSHIKSYYDIIKHYTVEAIDPYRGHFRNSIFLRTPFELVICIADCINVVFNIMNGKIIEVTVLNGYKGFYNNQIYVGMPLAEFIALEPEFYCDVAAERECYKNQQISGLSINHDPYFKIVESISVYVEELDEMDVDIISKFNKGEW